jgi:hypothetical protein
VRNPSGFEGVGFALVLGIPTLLSIFVAFFFLLPALVRNFLNPVEGIPENHSLYFQEQSLSAPSTSSSTFYLDRTR